MTAFNQLPSTALPIGACAVLHSQREERYSRAFERPTRTRLPSALGGCPHALTVKSGTVRAVPSLSP
jgi:hypothetical protein